ncbi:MAG: sulfotransferase family 2 domain-containing protein [Rhodocyclaceae bacterium]|nr:sulfotransferase family 2 domain-containing protein [Rhodocyclaceae bacterium]
MKEEYTVPDQRDLVAFVHIPKTAGTTLNAILAHQYAADETHEVMMRGMSWIMPGPRLLPRPLVSFSKLRRLKAALERHAVRLVRGHFDMSLAKRLPADTRYFTFLRDPVERAVSHYWHYRRLTADPIHALAMRCTLAEWVSAAGLVEMDNGQTRRLAGAMDLPCGRVTAPILERAKANLAGKFAVVGLTERFEESLVLLQRQFGWPLCRAAALNVGDGRPQRADVGADALKVVADCNRFDAELYRFAAALFEQAASRIDMAGELARLRAAPSAPRPPRAAPADAVDAAMGHRPALGT